MNRYTRISVDRLLPGAATRVAASGYAVAIYDVGGGLLAIDDTCLCCGASLGEGRLVGRLAICERCGWAYDLSTGAVEGVPALRIERFDVRIDGQDVRISLPAGADDLD